MRISSGRCARYLAYRLDEPGRKEALTILIENLETITRYTAAHNVRIAVEKPTRGYFSDPANQRHSQ